MLRGIRVMLRLLRVCICMVFSSVYCTSSRFYMQAFFYTKLLCPFAFKVDLNRLGRVKYMLCGYDIQPVSKQSEGKCNELGILVIPLKSSTLMFEKHLSFFSLNNNPPSSFDRPSSSKPDNARDLHNFRVT